MCDLFKQMNTRGAPGRVAALQHIGDVLSAPDRGYGPQSSYR